MSKRKTSSKRPQWKSIGFEPRERGYQFNEEMGVMVLAHTNLQRADSIAEMIAKDEDPTPEQHAEQQRVLTQAIQSFQVFVSLWNDLLHDCPSIGKTACDPTLLDRIECLLPPLEGELHDLAKSLSVAFAGRVAHAVKHKTQPPNYFPTEDSKDLFGKQLQIGDRVQDPECADAGIVYAIYGANAVYISDDLTRDSADDAGSWQVQQCAHVYVVPAVTDPAARREALREIGLSKQADAKAMRKHKVDGDDFVRGQRMRMRTPKESVDEFVEDVAGIRQRLASYLEATKGDGASDLVDLNIHVEPLDTLISDALLEGASCLDERDRVNALTGRAPHAYLLSRSHWNGSTQPYKMHATMPVTILTSNSVDEKGREVRIGDRIENLTAMAYGTVLAVIDDTALYVEDTEAVDSFPGGVMPVVCRECLIVSKATANLDLIALFRSLTARGEELRAQEEERAARHPDAKPLADITHKVYQQWRESRLIARGVKSESDTIVSQRSLNPSPESRAATVN